MSKPGKRRPKFRVGTVIRAQIVDDLVRFVFDQREQTNCVCQLNAVCGTNVECTKCRTATLLRLAQVAGFNIPLRPPTARERGD